MSRSAGPVGLAKARSAPTAAAAASSICSWRVMGVFLAGSERMNPIHQSVDLGSCRGKAINLVASCNASLTS